MPNEKRKVEQASKYLDMLAIAKDLYRETKGNSCSQISVDGPEKLPEVCYACTERIEGPSIKVTINNKVNSERFYFHQDCLNH
jgi:hypothetical protein